MAGNGTAQNPFEVATLSDLQKVGSGTDGWDLDCHYIQTADIDASETAEWNDGAGFEPIGAGYPFKGSYGGQGHKISGLTIDRSDGPYRGLFSDAHYEGCEILNIILDDVNITGDSYVGGVAGRNRGKIVGCRVSGIITGDSYVGGVAGSSTEEDGVVDCYSTASVSGNVRVGGLVGRSSENEITNCYSAGPVSGGLAYIGGLVGSDSGGIITNSFWDTETSGQSTSAGGTGKTTAEMMDIETYLDAGWDICKRVEFDPDDPTVWWIDDGKDYPRLGHEWTPPPPAWRIERKKDDGEWQMLEAGAEIEAVDGELVYDDEADHEHGATYQYRVKDISDPEAEWLESGEVYFGWAEVGAEAGITIVAEGKGIKASSAGAETAITVSIETGAGVKVISAGAETSITIDAEGRGIKHKTAGAEAGIIADPETGPGEKRGESGGAEAGTSIAAAAGPGLKISLAGAVATITINPESGVVKVSYGGAETGIIVTATGAGGKTIAFGLVIRLPAVVYDPSPLRLRGAVYDPSPIRLKGVKLHGYKQ